MVYTKNVTTVVIEAHITKGKGVVEIKPLASGT